MVNVKENYSVLIDFLSSRYEQVNGYDYYRFIFPDNENVGEPDADVYKPNAIYVWQNQNTKKRKKRIMFNDTWEKDYMEFVEGGYAVCGGLSYRGKDNTLENAQFCRALMFDLDEVGFNEISTLFLRLGKPSDTLLALPMPTFTVVSGTGLHIVYVLDEPIDLFPNIKLQLKEYRYALTHKMWDYKSTSQLEKIQKQGLNQAFRMVGSINEKYGTEVVAFRTGNKVSLNYLNQYVDEKHSVDINKRFKPSTMTREQAKINFPDWYDKVIVNKDKKAKKWDISGKVKGDNPYALYDWWKRKLEEGKVKGGHRYYFLLCMVIYACKCDVPYKKVKSDMFEIFDKVKEIEHTNPLTKEDIYSALEIYSKDFYNFKLNDIEEIAGFQVERNKRNGRKREDHIKLMNFIRDEINQNTNWREGNGRPKGSGTAELKVMVWRSEHPKGTKAQCNRDTGLDPKTIRKWWDSNGISETITYKVDNIDEFIKENGISLLTRDELDEIEKNS